MEITRSFSLTYFPEEVLGHLFTFLGSENLGNTALVCRLFNRIINDEKLPLLHLSKIVLKNFLCNPKLRIIVRDENETITNVAFNYQRQMLAFLSDFYDDTLPTLYLAKASHGHICSELRLDSTPGTLAIGNQNTIMINNVGIPHPRFFETYRKNSLKEITSAEINAIQSSNKWDCISNNLENGSIALARENRVEIFDIQGKRISSITIPLENNQEMTPLSICFSGKYIAVIHEITPEEEKSSRRMTIFSHNDEKRSISEVKHIDLEGNLPGKLHLAIEKTIIVLWSVKTSDPIKTSLQLIDFSLENPILCTKELNGMHSYSLHNGKLLNICKKIITVSNASGSDIIGKIDITPIGISQTGAIVSQHIYSMSNGKIAVWSPSQKTDSTTITIYNLENQCAPIAAIEIKNPPNASSNVESIVFKNTRDGETYLLVGQNNEVLLFVPSSPAFDHWVEMSDPSRFEIIIHDQK